MRELRRAAHTVYSLHYHFVFTTKYRKPVLVGDLRRKARERQALIDVRLRLRDLGRDLVDRARRRTVEQRFVSIGFFEWMYVLPLKVLDDLHFARAAIVTASSKGLAFVRRERGLGNSLARLPKLYAGAKCELLF